MSDPLSSVQETVVNGDVVTTITETKTVNADHSITTTTTVDKTDHADGDNHITTICQTTTPLNELDEEIIRQVEYYFSDQNYPHDEILQNEISKNDGWIPLSILTTFKRLQSITTDFSTVLGALKNSLSGLLQFDEDEQKVRRHPNSPLPNTPFDFQFRTVVIQRFPTTNDITLEKISNFFSPYHQSIDNIQMQRDSQTDQFSGSVLIVFADEDKAREFVDHAQQTPIKYDDGTILECSLYNRPKANLAGTLIHLADVAAHSTVDLIKEKFQPFAKLFWIDYNQGDSEAWVRLHEENTAKNVLDQVLTAGNGRLVIGDQEVTSRIVENDNDEQYVRRKRRRREGQADSSKKHQR